MDKPPFQPPLSRAQLIERRWERVRIGRVRATEPKPVVRQPKAPSAPPDPLRWRRRALRGAGVLAIALLVNVAAGWMRAPTAADVRAGEQLFAHKWVAHDPLSAKGDGLGPVFNARSCAECHFQ